MPGKALSQSPPDDKIIIETLPANMNDRYREVEGTWTNSWSKSTAADLTPKSLGGQTRKCVFVSTRVQATPGPAAARFLPKLTAPGHYHVYISWPEWANATPVDLIVKHAKGQQRKQVQQDGFGGSGPSNAHHWIALGDFDFAPGEDQYVEIRIDNSAKPVQPKEQGQVFADAVCFSKSALTNDTVSLESVAVAPGADTGPAPPAIVPAATAAPSGPAAMNPVEAAFQLNWIPDIYEARDLAKRSNKSILIFFRNPKAKRSQHLENKVFVDPAVVAALKDLVLVRMDFEESAQIASKLEVYSAGSVLLYDSRGKGLGRVDQQVSPEQFLKELRLR